VYCSVSQLHYCSRSVGLTFKLDSNPYAIQQLGVQRPNNSLFVFVAEHLKLELFYSDASFILAWFLMDINQLEVKVDY